jgi:hypothetical protein
VTAAGRRAPGQDLTRSGEDRRCGVSMGAEAKAIYQSLPWMESFPAQTAAPPAISTLSFWIRSGDTNTLMILSPQVQGPSHRIWGSLNDPQVGVGGTAGAAGSLFPIAQGS